MDSEFRRGEQVNTITWKCYCGKQLSEHDEVYYIDADEEPTTLGDIDDVGIGELFCSRECCRQVRASQAEDEANAERDCEDLPSDAELNYERWVEGPEDYEPNPYDGTYSEE